MGFISETNLLQIVDHNLIWDSRTRQRDVIIAKDIYRYNTSILNGKTMQITEDHVREDALMDVPHLLLDRYSKNVTLCADVMHVNDSHSSLPSLDTQKTFPWFSCIDKISRAYNHRGFTVTNMHMNNAFRWLEDDL